MYKSLSKIGQGFSELGSEIVESFRSSYLELSEEQLSELRKQFATEILEQINAHESPTIEKVGEILYAYK